MNRETQHLPIDPDLHERLSAMAEKQGIPFDELALNVLHNHADFDIAEDERRYQKYLETGESVSLEEFRANIQGYIQDARKRAAEM